MQKGRIERRGSGWYLMYRRPELVNGQPVMKQRVKKLQTITEEPAVDKDGNPIVPEKVRELANQILNPINANKGAFQPEPLETVIEFIEKKYLPYCDGKRRAVTAHGYRIFWNAVKPFLEKVMPDVTLRDVRTVHFQNMFDRMDAEKPRSGWTYSGIKFMLSGAMKYAIRKGIIDQNPITVVERPAGIPPKEQIPYTLDEVVKMLAVLKEPARTVVLFAALSGLRKAELMGLQWSDFQPDGSVLVQRSVWNGHVSPPKTQRSRGKVPVVSVLAKALEAHRASNGTCEWVFHGSTGQPMNLDNLTHDYIRPTLKKNKIRFAGWHNFRRGVGTLLHSLGVDGKTIQGILRHSRIQTTLDLYVKNDTTQANAAMDKLSAALESARVRKLA